MATQSARGGTQRSTGLNYRAVKEILLQAFTAQKVTKLRDALKVNRTRSEVNFPKGLHFVRAPCVCVRCIGWTEVCTNSRSSSVCNTHVCAQPQPGVLQLSTRRSAPPGASGQEYSQHTNHTTLLISHLHAVFWLPNPASRCRAHLSIGEEPTLQNHITTVQSKGGQGVIFWAVFSLRLGSTHCTSNW